MIAAPATSDSGMQAHGLCFRGPRKPALKLDRVEYGLTAHQPRRISRADRHGMLLAFLLYGGLAALRAFTDLTQRF